MSMTRSVGELFAGRFSIERVAGSGGMGTVYAARDLATDRPIALKLLQMGGSTSADIERFVREASVLAELAHPGIVSYVAHGAAPDGQRFLAMEWLSGEDLGKRLRRGPLAISETIALLRQVAPALALAHRRGVIHRDLKPSNLFLVDGEVSRIKILDFGIARRLAASQVMTRTGLVIGTPEYMAPEQARGDRDITASSDIFSLGCVVYECLTGQAPFGGEHVAAVLVRILFETPTALRQTRPGVPDSLACIVEGMLQKDPSRRLADGQALVDALASIPSDPVAEDALAATQRIGLSTVEISFGTEEQQLLSVVIASEPGHSMEDAKTAELRVTPLELVRRTELQQLIAQAGAKSEWLLDGALVATLSGLGSATDQTNQAARVALLVKEKWPDSVVALATGRAAVLGNLPVGEAVDMAARLLRSRVESSTEVTRSSVWIDDLSASLLARRFALTRRDGLNLLSGELLAPDDSYRLLGKPTPCVGREQELGLLEILLNGTVEESTAQAALITAKSGLGKTRLCREFLRRIQQHDQDIFVLRGEGDPLTGGSPYAILRTALRHFLLPLPIDEQPQSSAQHQLLDSIGNMLDGPNRQVQIAMLGELCGVPFPDENLPALRAARKDPKIFGDQISEAVVCLLSGMSAHKPVLLVLEDLHWSDALSVKLLATVLKELAEQPILVLALARPEIHERFPRLWAGLRLREVVLSPVSKKASEKLIFAALGKGLSPDICSKLIEHSGGNPLYLEELIRAAASGQLDQHPPTILALLQGRIGQLDPAARRVIRAASIYGSVFKRDGVRALLQTEKSTNDLRQGLRQLLDAELLSSRSADPGSDDDEYVFRNALIRDAAYGLLTDEDRHIGHRRAAEYLEQSDEQDPLAIAEHLVKGEQFSHAATYFLRAGLRSFECNDLEEALRRAKRGLEYAEPGQTQGELRTLLTMAFCWRSELSAAYEQSILAWPLLVPGSRWESSVLFHGMWAALVTGYEIEFSRMASALCTFQPMEAEAARSLVLWGSLGASLLTSYGRKGLAKELLAQAEATRASSTALEKENDLRGALRMGQSDFIRAFGNDPWLPLVLSQEATVAFQDIGDRRDQVTAMNRLGQAQGDLGQWGEGEKTLRDALELAKRVRIPFAVLQTELHLAALLCAVDDEVALSEAQTLGERILKTPGLSAGYTGWCHGILASVALRRHLFDISIEQSRKAIPLCNRVPLRLLWVQSLLTNALLAMDAKAEAAQVVQKMLIAQEELGGGYMEIVVRQAASRTFRALGLSERSAMEQRNAESRLNSRAEKILDAVAQMRYVQVHKQA